MCLAFVVRSITRKTTKLAGTNDIAMMTKMAITASVPCRLQSKNHILEERISIVFHSHENGYVKSILKRPSKHMTLERRCYDVKTLK